MATSNRIPEDEDVTLNTESFPVEKKLFTRRHFPRVAIEENTNVLPESVERFGALGTQSTKKQHPSESSLRIRRALQRRSYVPSLMNTESLSPKVAVGPPKDRVEKTNMGISPAAYSSGGNQEGSITQKPQESFAQSLGITFEPRLAGRRRRSRPLWQEEGSQTKARDKDSECCHQSATKKQNEGIVENEEKTNWSPSRFTETKIKMNNQQEAASGNKNESEPHVDAERSHTGVRRRRSIHDIVRQRALAFSQAPTEEPTASKQGRVSSLKRIQGNSMKRRRSNRWTPYENSETNVKQGEPHVTDLTGQEEPQECRRMLQFESASMNDGGKELTSPLVMMAQTPIISRASVLQNPVDQTQLKEISGPVIKKSLFDHNMKTSIFRRRWSTRLNPQPEDISVESHQNKELKIAVPDNFNKCENSLDEALVGCRKEPRNRDLNNAFGNIITISKPVKESNTYNCTSSVRGENFPQHPRSTKKVQRRRSVAVLGLRTPLRRKSANFEVKSTSKSNSCTLSKIPELRGSKNCAKPRKSFTSTNNLSVYPQTTNMVLPNNEGQEKDNLAQNEISKDVSLKVDASTSTSLDSISAKHEDMKTVDDIENLLKEQEEIIIKACLLQKKIEARRRDMKEKKLMESFITSISPLKRLKAMISKTIVDDGNESQENPQQCKTEGDSTACEGDAQGPHVGSKIEVDWLSPRAAPVISDHQSHWRRQQNKRLVRTSQDSTPENEEFLDPRQGSSSPFTTLVGDCERPSLAPMTPHSRYHVLQIRKSLKKQLEQLYD